MLMTRNDIRTKESVVQKTRVVSTPMWGDILIKRLSVVQQERYWQILSDQKKGTDSPTGIRGSLVYMCCINEDGSDFWNEEDAAWLGSEASSKDVQVLYDAICELSGIDDKSQAEIEKKRATLTDSSSDGSVSKSADESTLNSSATNSETPTP